MVKKTKIICTIGPASWDYETLKKLALAGMDVARLNFSHGTHEEKKQVMEYVRQISKELDKPIALYADMSGPKLRLGEIDGQREIKAKEVIQLSLNPTSEELPMQFDLSPFVKKGQRIFLNDALVELKVTEVRGKTIVTVAQNSGVVSSHKGVNIPDTDLKNAAFTQKDSEDAEFALAEGVDYLGLSFVQNTKVIDIARNLIKKHNSKAKILVKVEKMEAINNLEEIVAAADAVMVARGDLAIETSAAIVPILQQKMIKLCRQMQKPVIVATQMLESMTENPRPTRAEASDVANAVMDQVDAIMLSAESAQGKYPVQSVETMVNIIESVEGNIDYKRYVRIDWTNLDPKDLALNAITSSAASISYRIGAEAIVVGTRTGRTARILSSFRPDSRIIAVVHDQVTSDQLALVWGVTPIIVKPTNNFNTFLDHINDAVSHLLKKGSEIVVVTGISAGVSGTTNTIKVTTL